MLSVLCPSRRSLLRRAAAASIAAAACVSAASAGAEAVRPAAAAAFLDTIGVNTHFGFLDTDYADHDALVAALGGLGIKHLRDSGDRPVAETLYWDRLHALGEAGHRFDLIFSGEGAATIEEQLANPLFRRLLPSVRYVEGWNEPDIARLDEAVAYQGRIHAAVRAEPGLDHAEVLGPSLHREDTAAGAGDLSAVLDRPVIHNYWGDRNPETAGWGGRVDFDGESYTYGSLAYNVAKARQSVSGPKKSVPVVSTETGWSAYLDPDDPDRFRREGVTDETRAAYVPRLFLEHFASGEVEATYLYELVDLRDDPADDQANYGLLSYDEAAGRYEENATGRALRGLIERLSPAGPGGAVTGPALDPDGTLGLEIDGGGPDLRHLLFDRGDGSVVLALWLAVPLQDPDSSTLYPVAPEPVELTLEDSSLSATLHAVDAEGRWSAAAAASDAGRLTVGVGGRLTLVELRGATPVPEPAALSLLAVVGLVGLRRRPRR